MSLKGRVIISRGFRGALFSSTRTALYAGSILSLPRLDPKLLVILVPAPIVASVVFVTRLSVDLTKPRPDLGCLCRTGDDAGRWVIEKIFHVGTNLP